MTVPEPGTPEPDSLQFDRAERVAAVTPGPMSCALCNASIETEYFEANGKLLCGRCAAAVRAAAENRGRFGRAALFGFGGAILGTLIYYAVLVATGYEIGLIAILVGFLVGKAVSLGAAGGAGRRYQVLAVVLTYLSIGATFIPIAMGQLAEKAVRTTDGANSPAQAKTAIDGTATSRTPLRQIAVAVGSLVVLAAAMPLLTGFGNLPSSLIGLLILGFALQQAWRMNHRHPISVTGPFRAPGIPPPAPEVSLGG